MKYFWTLLFSLIIITSCDDGDIIEDTFNFESATVQKCSNSNVLFPTCFYLFNVQIQMHIYYFYFYDFMYRITK